jgi:hypothetical protein
MPERFRVVLADMGGDAPAVVRLRAALKRLARSYRLRCLEAVELAEDGAAGQAQPGPPRPGGGAADPGGGR